MTIRFGFIGGGVMGEALLSRLLAQNLYAPYEVIVSEPSGERRDFLAATYQVQVTGNNVETLEATEGLLLAVKPQVLDQVVEDLPLEARCGCSALVLSILAGVPLVRLEAAFPQQAVIRVMPNTPAMVGAGMTAIAPGTQTRPEHITLAQNIFAVVGQVVQVPESQMDAVTGLSGSGPAFVALMIEALSDGGVAAGLSRGIAQQLAVQTVLGTAQLMQDKGLHPALLKDQVTSPAGTTIAGVALLESKGFRSAVIEAVKAAYARSKELGLAE
ncbi:pyrroline-5-carboxylate reductase [Spirulina subsalsa FACHB-351]|uniref:Pyrroline-5-carboxylate reductase n=1 Tax=Spirulina subsalsa FACHB-351 TaxID=234711 RepID=A0ABT3L0I8_9CYAN|nr:pyrroline-5-carboxylate reductase [Spirulina subsalsa]MCW6035017.1 pyrroline-5-carboxylate reductase [Spirulina subsalsa FACHB-351]